MTTRLWPHRLYRGSLSDLGRMRRDLCEDLPNLDAELLDTLLLCGSEIFANCVKYSASGHDGGHVIRTLRRQGGFLCLGFTDDGLGGTIPTVPRSRTADEWADAEGGRGLLLVEELSTAWGYRPVCPWGDLGHHTWAAFPLPAAAR
ncbi:ATP-binding protein [Nocardiopsis protaetiae]|uniref:ATP-binding protein n=1 Tax=Nocardiopsis protaetiae TaxID=3382270 RepID=UPI00387B679D